MVQNTALKKLKSLFSQSVKYPATKEASFVNNRMSSIATLMTDFEALNAKERLSFLQKALELLAGGKKGKKSKKESEESETESEKPKTAWQEHCARVRGIRAALMEEHTDKDFDPKAVMTIASTTYDKASKNATATDEELREALMETTTERDAPREPKKTKGKKAAGDSGDEGSTGSKSAWQEHCANVRAIQKVLKEEYEDRTFGPKDVMAVASATYDKATKAPTGTDEEIRTALMDKAVMKEEAEAKADSEVEEKPKSVAKGKGKGKKEEPKEDASVASEGSGKKARKLPF